MLSQCTFFTVVWCQSFGECYLFYIIPLCYIDVRLPVFPLSAPKVERLDENSCEVTWEALPLMKGDPVIYSLQSMMGNSEFKQVPVTSSPHPSPITFSVPIVLQRGGLVQIRMQMGSGPCCCHCSATALCIVNAGFKLPIMQRSLIHEASQVSRPCQAHSSLMMACSHVNVEWWLLQGYANVASHAGNWIRKLNDATSELCLHCFVLTVAPIGVKHLFLRGDIILEAEFKLEGCCVNQLWIIPGLKCLIGLIDFWNDLQLI